MSEGGVDAARAVTLSDWLETARALRDEGYRFFDVIIGVEQVPPGHGRRSGRAQPAAVDGDLAPTLDVLLRLLDPGAPGQLREVWLRTQVAGGEALPSLTGVFRGAAWHERELAEMFGIEVAGFDDGSGLGMRPLLLPHGFVGHPLRHSFVLASRALTPWPGAKEPGESSATAAATSGAASSGAASSGRGARRRAQPPGVPGPAWGPR